MKIMLHNQIYTGLLIALVLRLLAAYFYHPLINQDELTILYDAKSIVETGSDRWNTPSHLIYRSLGKGDYRPPMLFWIFSAAYYLFEIGPYGARVVSILIGLLSIWLSYQIGKRLVNELLGKIFFWVLVFAPIHILTTSQAFETTSINYSFMLLPIYFWLRYEENFSLKWIVLTAISLGLSVYTYQAPKLIAPLIVILIATTFLVRKKVKEAFILCIIAFLISIPQLYVLIQYPEFYTGRAANTVPLKLKGIDYILSFITNPLISLLDIRYWFLNIQNIAHNCNLLFLFFQFPFYIIGLFQVFNSDVLNGKKVLLTFLVFYIGTIPEAITFTNLNFLRNSYLIFFIAFIISLGIYFAFSKIKWIVIVLALNFIIQFFYSYSLETRFYGFQPELVELFTKLKKFKNKAKSILIEESGNMPDVYLIYFSDISPTYFKNALKKVDASSCWDRVLQIDKFYFVNQEFIKDSSYPSPSGILVTTIDTNLLILDTTQNFKIYKY